MRKVVVVAVGHSWEHAFRAAARHLRSSGASLVLAAGLGEGAGEEAARRAEELYPGVDVERLWLSPELPLELSAARVRRAVEARAPCEASFSVSQDAPAWLALATAYAALASCALSRARGVSVSALEVYASGPEPHRAPAVPLASLDLGLVRALELARGGVTVKELGEALGTTVATASRRLNRLAGEGLVEARAEGRRRPYRLSPLGVMLVG